MGRALAISAAGLGSTSPNPPVGCVLLGPAGQVIAEGFHERKGEAHAEAQALSAAGGRAAGATAMVTLEPCNHHGRTPPCHQALIDAQIRRVVIAVIDPTSRGQGGAAALRAAGVDVEVGVLADEARVVLGPWLAPLQASRPSIIWPYLIRGHRIVALPWTAPGAEDLKAGADAFLHENGQVTEAVPGSHGDGMLSITHLAAGDSAARIAERLFQGGIRRLILRGGYDMAAPFLAAGLIGSVHSYLPDGPASRLADVPPSWPLLPPGFTIRAVTRLRGFVRVDAQPVRDGSLRTRSPELGTRDHHRDGVGRRV
jgi:diaminohydroxyphosphoribosylaminopyrimidine deaminase/5-amino-6-(5-phosphoribosylamino)uracil reductase